MATSPVTLDFSTAKPIATSGGVKLDFSTAKPISPARPAGLPAGVDLPQLPAHPAVTMNAPRTIQGSFDQNTRINPGESLLNQGLKSVVHGAGSMLVHPIKAAQSLLPTDYATQYSDAQQQPKPSLAEGVVRGLGEGFGGLATGAATGMAVRPLMGPVSEAGSAIRNAAIGDTDAAALRGLRVPANGKKVLPMQSNVQLARPFLQGAESLEDLQSRIKPAKNEIFSPYRQTLDEVGNNPVKGPDGMTTIGDLEKERLELSAMNRGLKSGDPSSLQLAQQKGLSQADALAREKLVQSHLDPELSRYGIDPQAIRKNYGAVSQIGNQIQGRSTLLEKPQPSGFGRMANIDLKSPKTWLGEPAAGVRDLIAGRPLLSGSPTDIGIREGFRGDFEKPNFGKYTPFKSTGLLNSPAIDLNGPPEVGGTPEGFRPPNFYHDTDAMRTGRLLNAPPIELGGAVEGSRPPAYYHDTTPMRTGRLLPEGEAPPIQLHGATEGAREPIFHYDTTPMRQGRLLPAPGQELPLSSYSDIFPDQRPGSRLMPKTIEGNK